MSKKRHRKIVLRLLLVLFALAAVVWGVLWQFEREVPRFVRVRLERKLSQGMFSLRFDHASISLFRGITIKNVRMHVKRTLDPPLMTIGELRLKGSYRSDRPIYACIRAIEADDLVCRPFLELPNGGGGMRLADFLRYSTVDHDWYSEPIRVSLRNADVFSVKCRRADFLLHARNNLVTADSIQLDIFSRGFDESLSGWTTFTTPCEIHSRLSGMLTPEVVEDFVDFLGGATANRIARRFDDYSAPPQVVGEVIWKSSQAEGVSARQDFRLSVQSDGLTYRGVPLTDLKFCIQWMSVPQGMGRRDRRLSVGPIEIGLNNGSANVALAWNPETHATDVRTEAMARPEDMARLLGRNVSSAMTNFTFQANPSITAEGRIMPEECAEKTVVSGQAKIASVTAHGVPLQDVSFDFRLHGDDIIDLTNITARAFDGDCVGYVRISDYDNAPTLDMDLALRGADCLKVRRHFLNNDLEGRGTLDAHLDLHGMAGTEKLDTLHGAADLTIRGGNILRIPLFAGLTDFIGRNVPGVDLLVMQSDADINCTLTNGLATIERVAVSGNLFSLVASGRCRINREGMPIDMVTQLRFFHSQSLIGKLARLVTLPVSKMMEFRMRGPIANPEWSYIGVIDRIKSIFWSEEDITAPVPVAEDSEDKDGDK